MEDGRARVTLDTPAGHYGPLTLSLRGAHQVSNAVVATRLLEAARERGIHVSARSIERALASTEAHKVVPLPHPSWRNTAWLGRNPWFETDLLPALRLEVRLHMQPVGRKLISSADGF